MTTQDEDRERKEKELNYFVINACLTFTFLKGGINMNTIEVNVQCVFRCAYVQMYVCVCMCVCVCESFNESLIH